MVYTFQISDESTQSQSIINMLLTLSEDYDFLKVLPSQNEVLNELTMEQERELDCRYENFLKNPDCGKPWNKVRQDLQELIH